MTAGAPTLKLTGFQRFAIVVAGGAVGTAIRAGLGLFAHPWIVSVGALALPLTTLAINAVGAFLLGYLVERLAGRGQIPPTRRWESVRLGLGTGVLGGFTTYSALAVDTVLLATVDLRAAVAYSGATLLGGALASWAGIAIAMRHSRESLRGQRRDFLPHPGDAQ